MDGIKGLMSKKIGGVPVGVFVALGAAALLWYVIRMPSTNNDPVAEDVTDTGSDGGDVNTDQPVFSATPVIYQPSGGSVASTPQEDSNELWGRRVTEWLIANGSTVDEASGMVTNYLSGQSLTQDQAKLRDKAVAKYGLPPEGVEYAPIDSPSGSYNGPATKQGEPPLSHEVKGKSDDSPAELARLYYGMNNADAVQRIQAANTSLVTPYKRGTKVRIPAWHDPKYFKATSATRTLYDIAKKNGTTPDRVQALNPQLKFPVKVGTRVQVK